MSEVWFPLLIDTGPDPIYDVNDKGNIVADWANNKIYTFGFADPFGPADFKLWAHDATTGAFIQSNLVSAICGISNNTILLSPSFCLGADGFLYTVTTNLDDAQANLRLSKISLSTMQETAAVTPYAITNLIGEGYTISYGGDWRLTPFRLTGVDYVALLLAGSDPANIEVLNSNLTSLASYNYSAAGGSAIALVAGEQPSSILQKLYLMTESSSSEDDITFVVATFSSTGPSLSDAVLVTLHATGIDATWTDTPDPDPYGLEFYQGDASLIFRVLNDADPAVSKVVKLSAATGAVLSTITIGTGIFDIYDPQFGQASIASDLSAGTLIVPSPTSMNYFTVHLTDFSSISGSSTHFDGQYGGIAQCSGWNGTQSRLLFYKTFFDGENDLSSAWPSGGWAVWGLDTNMAHRIGGTNFMLDCDELAFRTSRAFLAKIHTNSELEIGPFRFPEQKHADETSAIDSLVIGVSESLAGEDVVSDDWLIEDEDDFDEDWGDSVLAVDDTDDWGRIPGFPDYFDTELMATDDGMVPQFPQVEQLEVIEELNSARQYSPQGTSAIMHRLKLKTSEAGHKFYFKYADIAGLLTGRHK